MAARGILRLARQLNISGNTDMKLQKIFVRSVQSLSRGYPLDSGQNATVSKQRRQHSLVVHESKCNIIPNSRQLQPARSYKVSQFTNGEEEETGSDEVNGAFDKFDLSDVTQNKLRNMGINHLFPVQYHTFKPTIEGTDVIVQARTGTGKTLSFALPIVEKLQRDPNRFRQRGRVPLVIVLAPTRELANQVTEEFSRLSNSLQVACVYGGVSQIPQVQAFRNGVDVVVGTPGRVKDLMEQGVLDLSCIEHVILDEVDQMLDMGFSQIVEEIISGCYEQGDKPQTMLYSATMPHWVKNTAKRYLDADYKMINLVGMRAEQTATTIKQYALKCQSMQKPTLIHDLVQLYTETGGRVIVFCQTKKEVDELSGHPVLKKDAKGLHGDNPQASRSYILKGFKDGGFRILITTDVAARGLDIANVELIIQAQPPKDSNMYIHRVGRTGRAGKSGVSILLYDNSDSRDKQECEQIAKVSFEHLSHPSLEQMLHVCVQNAVKDILKVPEELSNHFDMAAEMMIEEKGAKEMLSAAMALVSNASTYSNRSLITNQTGYSTLLYSSGESLTSHRNASGKIHRSFRLLNVPVHNIHLLHDANGAVFDVETEILQTVLEGFDAIRDDDSEAIEKLTTLPRIIPKRQEFTERRQYTDRRSGGSFRNRSRFGMDDDDDNDDISSYSNSGSRYQNKNRYERSDRSHSYNNRQRDSRNSYRQRDDGDFDRRSRQMKMSQFDEDY